MPAPWVARIGSLGVLARGIAAHTAPTALAAVDAGYARDENDEFVLPTVVGMPRPIRMSLARCLYKHDARPSRSVPVYGTPNRSSRPTKVGSLHGLPAIDSHRLNTRSGLVARMWSSTPSTSVPCWPSSSIANPASRRASASARALSSTDTTSVAAASAS